MSEKTEKDYEYVSVNFTVRPHDLVGISSFNCTHVHIPEQVISKVDAQISNLCSQHNVDPKFYEISRESLALAIQQEMAGKTVFVSKQLEQKSVFRETIGHKGKSKIRIIFGLEFDLDNGIFQLYATKVEIIILE